MNFAEFLFRDCMKSSWRSPDGGSSVARNTEIEPSGAVFCAWWATGLRPIQCFHTVSPRRRVNKGEKEPGVYSPQVEHFRKEERSPCVRIKALPRWRTKS